MGRGADYVSHFLAHITRSQFELEVGLMKIILSLNRSWIDETNSLLKWKSD